MRTGTKTGARAALEAIPKPLVDPAVKQLRLFGGPTPSAHAGGPLKSKGRPKGSRNKATEDFVRFITSQYGTPGEVLARTYARPVRELAAELGCSLKEAHELRMKAADALMPYMHSKRPIEANVNVNLGLAEELREARLRHKQNQLLSPEERGMLDNVVLDSQPIEDEDQ